MAQFELIMPKMGESIMEATILKWLKNEGDIIEAEDSVLEIATDKVDSEVPSPVGGILLKKLYAENEVVAVGKAIALINTQAEASAKTVSNTVIETAHIAQHTIPVYNEALQQSISGAATSDRFYSPLVLNIAREENIAMTELESIGGTGKDGRVTKKDILDYVAQRKQAPVAQTQTVAPTVVVQERRETPIAAPTAPKVEYGDNVEIIEMDRMRRLIADHMVMSKHVSPHVTSFVEVDVTNMVKWRDRIKSSFEKREGEKITFTPIFIEAVTQAIKEFPLINSSVDGNNIIVRKNINIGMAAALASGNLIVPVIKNADHKNLIGLTKEVNGLANRARQGKLKPEDIQGGTFTLSNVGTFGSVMGTPIINQPQVAILATGTIRKKPAVIETEYGDVIAIRQQMFMSLSYDHRIIDGSLGSRFLKRVADLLENFDINREI
jgi:2-oxoglutarate dehydrogenase E2 component (dihydrolipoamide succinyltransferase)